MFGRIVGALAIASTALTLLAIPTFYDLAASARDRVIARLRRRRRRQRTRPAGR